MSAVERDDKALAWALFATQPTDPKKCIDDASKFAAAWSTFLAERRKSLPPHQPSQRELERLEDARGLTRDLYARGHGSVAECGRLAFEFVEAWKTHTEPKDTHTGPWKVEHGGRD